MSPAARDQLLKMLLPTILTVVAYVWLFGRGAQQQLGDTGRRLEEARAKPPATQHLKEQQARLQRVTREQQALAQERAALQQQLDAWRERFTQGRQRPGALGDLAGLLHHHGLVLVEEAPAGGADEQLSVFLKRLRDKLAQRPPEEQPQLWRLRFVGAYLNVLEVLHVLADGEAVAIPVSLSMQDAPAQVNWRYWTLIVWL
ncbi:MAG: hypothetical protein AB7N91_04155 [Candidatus Tectimicrobiota bacterium]